MNSAVFYDILHFAADIRNVLIIQSKLCLQGVVRTCVSQGGTHFFTLVFVLVFVLMGWPLLPNALRTFRIHCAPPDLGIART